MLDTTNASSMAGVQDTEENVVVEDPTMIKEKEIHKEVPANIVGPTDVVRT